MNFDTSPDGGTRIEHKSLSSIVEERLKSIIRSGQLKSGDRIPSHNELCKRWGVSLTTLRDALTRLESAGVIEKIQGSGTFVKPVALDKLMTYQEINGILVKEDRFHAQLVEVRATIEPRIAELVAGRRNEDQLHTLQRVLHEFDRCSAQQDHISYVQTDRKFHLTLSEMADNLFLHKIMKELEPSIGTQQLEIMTLSEEEQRGWFTQSQADHRDIVSAIVAQNTAEAGSAMRRHILLVGRFFGVTLDDAPRSYEST